MAISYGYYHHLNRSKPHRKRSTAMLNQRSHKPFHASQHGSMDHNHTVFMIIGANIANIEAFWQVKVNLDGRPLPGTPQGIPYLYIYLGAIKDTLPGVHNVGQLHFLQNLFQGICSTFPHFCSASIFLRPGRQKQFVFIKIKGSHHILN